MNEKGTKTILRLAEMLEHSQQENIKLEQENKRYRKVIREANQIMVEAYISIDKGEKVNGLEYGATLTYKALEESE